MNEISEGPRVSARALIVQGHRILLSRYKDDRGYWYILPGGGVKRGETLTTALTRECLEELNASIEIGELITIREVVARKQDQPYLPAGFHQIEHFFRCQLTSELGKATAPDPNQHGYEWVPLYELENRLFFPVEMVPMLISGQFPSNYLGEIR